MNFQLGCLFADQFQANLEELASLGRLDGGLKAGREVSSREMRVMLRSLRGLPEVYVKSIEL